MERRHQLNGGHRLLVRRAAPIGKLVPSLSEIIVLAIEPRSEIRPRSVEPHLGLGCKIVDRSEEHTSELQSLMRISYAVFCLKKKTNIHIIKDTIQQTRTHKNTNNTH